MNIPEDWKEDCEKCGKPFRIRYGRRGGFIAWCGYPDCKNSKPFRPEWLDDQDSSDGGAPAPKK